MRVIGYTCATDQGLSLDDQRAALERFCQDGGHTLVETFVDHDAGRERPQFQELRGRLEASRDGFLVTCAGAEYLGADLADALERILALEVSPIHRMVCADAAQPHPLHSALAYWTRRNPGMDRGERIREAMRAKAGRGEGLGKPPYGYRIGQNGKLEVLQEEAQTVQRIYQLYTQRGQGIRTIARSLNEADARTRRGRPWSMVTIRDILRNRAYLGTYSRFGMLVPGNHTPLITREMHREAQALMQSRSRPRRPAQAEPFLLSGVAYCSACGNRMIGVARRQRWRRRDGAGMERLYRYYQCQSRTNHSLCQFHTWRAVALEEEVKRQILDGVAAKRVALGQERRRHAEKQGVVAARREEQRLLEELRQVVQRRSSLTALGQLLEEVRGGNSGLTEKRGAALPEARVRTAADLEAAWASRPVLALRELLRGLVERIEVEDEGARVIFAAS